MFHWLYLSKLPIIFVLAGNYTLVNDWSAKWAIDGEPGTCGLLWPPRRQEQPITMKTGTIDHNPKISDPPPFTTIENVTLKKWFLSKYAKDHLLRLVLEKKALDDLSNPTDEFKYFAEEILRKQEVVSDFFWRKQPSSAPWYLFIPTKPTQTGRPEYGAGITNIGSLENEVIRLCLAALSLSLFRLGAGFWKLVGGNDYQPRL